MARIHSHYLECILDPAVMRRLLTTAVKELKAVEFDAFAVTGYSGAIFGGALSARMKKPLIMVRKTIENCHSYMPVEGCMDGKTYIFLDDAICTGNTMKAVETALYKSSHFHHMAILGYYLYDSEFENETPTGRGYHKRSEFKEMEVPF